ncbi:MAG TPA: hypothetical protein VH253_05050 [Phycisphaerae bacterium]|nr:hypothetical protein [Phycisphaerae bacterium]
MIGSSRSYAIGMAHFQLAGGALSLGLMLSAYALIFGAVVGSYLYYGGTPYAPAKITDAAITILFMVEALVLLLFGAARISLAIRNDVSSRMMESHRLMPIPAWRAVAGYLLGGTTHALAFAGLTLIFAWILAAAAHVPLGDVAFNQGLLLLFAGLVWSAAALLTLIYRHAFFIALGMALLGICSSFLVYATIFLPGVLLLMGPLIGQTVFRYSSPVRLEWGFAASIAGQAAFFALFFNGACRRYRGMYATTFTATQAFLLVLAWVFVSVCGMGAWKQFLMLPRPYEWDQPGFYAMQVVASIVVGMLLSLIPAYTMAVEQGESRRMAYLAWPLVVVTAVALALIPFGTDQIGGLTWKNVGITFLTVAPFVMAAYLFCRWYRLVAFGWVVLWLSVGVVVLWLAPMVVALVAYLVLPGDSQKILQTITTLSPIGLLIDRWVEEPRDQVSPIAGMIVQWVGPGMLLLLAWALRRVKRGATEDRSGGSGMAAVGVPAPPAVG